MHVIIDKETGANSLKKKKINKMARISTYSTDSSITGSEKLLGTDSGTTKLFSLSDLSTYFTNTVTLTGSFGADLLPNADGTYDLGSTTYEW